MAVTARAAGLAVELFAQEEASAIASLPPPDAIDALRQKIVQLSAQRAVIDPTKTGQDYANYMNLTAAISSATNAIGDQIKKQQSQQDLLKQTQDQIRLNNAAGNEELVIQEKVAQAYDQKLRVLKEAGIPEEQAKQAAQSYAESVRQAAEVRAGAGADVSIQERLTELMRQQATILQGIRQQQELINQNPLLGIDAKNSALMQTYVQEMQQLQQVITALNTQKQSGLLDPAQLALVDQRLQQANFQLQLLQLKMVGLQRPLSTELINWANSFGSTWQQVGQSIQQSVNTSLQSLNQLLLTGKFNAQQLYQQLGNIALQLLEHIAIQQIMAAIGRASRAENVAAGPVTAAAWAPAAAATSVGSFGTSAVVGEAAALAAIFAIMGALVAHEGGAIGGRRLRRMHDGGLASDEHLIIAQDDEVMIQRSVARQPGMTEFLLGLNAGRFHEGGHIGGPPLTYGPGSPDATASDLNQFWGSYDNRLHWGDIAVAPGSGITPGKNSFIEIGGHWYHVADYSYYSPNHPTPPGTWEIYYPRGGGRESGNTRWDRIFGGKTTGGRPGYRGPGDPPARLLGFGKGGRNSRMGFPGFNARRGGFDMGGIGGDRPGFVDYTGSVPGGYDPYMSGHEWGSYDPITGRVTVGYTPGGYSGSGGIPPGGYTSSGGSGPELPWQGGSAFGTHSGAPSGYDAHGNPVYGGQMGGFNIPGGIGLPGLGRGSGGDIPFFSRMALNRFRSGGDPSFGFGPGSALYDFAAARHGRGGWSRRFAGRPTVNFGGVGQFERGNATRFGPNARAMSRVHGGGLIGNMRIPRLHGGGGIGGASSANLRSGEGNIHNYTDLKTLVKEMATRKGRNIIVDTVRGSRIDLGMR